ncbi:MAG: chemotaxis-specific protein-glutamate methyltransferase CheB [Negativicutes bacterium]|nr:chemotaxis-specific protein-glutamate methyltransferase CheB [Negativicutes bacterium]
MIKLRVVIIDDSVIYRRVLCETVTGTGLATVIGTAADGQSGLEKVAAAEVDIVLLDIFLPDINGIEVLAAIRRQRPDLPVIMISSGGRNNAEWVLKSLQNGAMDFIVKPSGDNVRLNTALLRERLGKLFADILRKRIAVGGGPAPVLSGDSQQQRRVYMSSRVPIVIAASTGGPAALESLLQSLSGRVVNPILIVQHMPPEFTKPLAEGLAVRTGRTVVEAAANMPVSEGLVVIAPGGWHLRVKTLGSSRLLELTEDDYVNGVRPAADVLFDSVADAYSGQRVIALILTGMGQDGTAGLRRIKQQCVCYAIAQDEETSVIFGMPRSAAEAGLINEMLPLGCIGPRLAEIVGGSEVYV